MSRRGPPFGNGLRPGSCCCLKFAGLSLRDLLLCASLSCEKMPRHHHYHHHRRLGVLIHSACYPNIRSIRKACFGMKKSKIANLQYF